MGYKHIEESQLRKYNSKRALGWGVKSAAGYAGFSERQGWRLEKTRDTVSKPERGLLSENLISGPIPYDRLSAEAKRAWGDFGYFQQRYFGCIPTPWQHEAANQIVELLESPEKEFAVLNVAPGTGKTTVFTLHIPAWLTVRNRSIRGMVGSRTEISAKKYVRRLRRFLEMPVPYQPEEEDVAKGLAVDAAATLADDFGSFKPEQRDVWASEAFVVAQHGNVLIAEKEATWTAYGMDSGFLGMRFDFIVWDDLCDKLTIRTEEARANQQEWWDDVAEKRLEPAGLLLLQGQRMGAADLYRYALDKRSAPDTEDGAGDWAAKYHHIVFRAHYEDRCKGEHSRTAPYYPDGCLLDPRRVSWREITQETANPRRNFAVIYQQEDADPESVLVDPIWVYGGTDKTGFTFPGCVDRTRDRCQLPQGLAGDLLSVATADPSPTKWWSVQWWIVRCVDGQAQERYLMDHERRAMTAADFLDWSEAQRSFTGLMEEWQARSVDMGHPINAWIVEKNGAQRFLLQYDHVRRWMAHWRVDLIPHETERNKSDPEFGVQVLASLYRYGLIRLPFTPNGAGKLCSMKLIEEVCHWPGFSTEDCVMAQWFLEWRLPSLVPAGALLPRFNRPSWLRKVDTYSWKDKFKRSSVA